MGYTGNMNVLTGIIITEAVKLTTDTIVGEGNMNKALTKLKNVGTS